MGRFKEALLLLSLLVVTKARPSVLCMYLCPCTYRLLMSIYLIRHLQADTIYMLYEEVISMSHFRMVHVTLMNGQTVQVNQSEIGVLLQIFTYK